MPVWCLYTRDRFLLICLCSLKTMRTHTHKSQLKASSRIHDHKGIFSANTLPWTDAVHIYNQLVHVKENSQVKINCSDFWNSKYNILKVIFITSHFTSTQKEHFFPFANGYINRLFLSRRYTVNQCYSVCIGLYWHWQ